MVCCTPDPGPGGSRPGLVTKPPQLLPGPNLGEGRLRGRKGLMGRVSIGGMVRNSQGWPGSCHVAPEGEQKRGGGVGPPPYP